MNVGGNAPLAGKGVSDIVTGGDNCSSKVLQRRINGKIYVFPHKIRILCLNLNATPTPHTATTAASLLTSMFTKSVHIHDLI